ncbi:MAG: hypothetical protein DRO06_02440 [Thermoproteota archaeon]|nr:MAG: hypothetical protein DRO06_02440 [Candidatus Korarchaeota archaeon]
MDPPLIDRRLGMLAYSTDSPPVAARLRARLSDFVVVEVAGGVLASEAGGAGPPWLSGGDHAVFSVAKVGVETAEAAARLGRFLRSEVSYCGLKDKRSVSIQFMSCRVRNPPRLLRLGRISARLVGFSPERVHPGLIDGNRFFVIARGERIPPPRVSRFPNFFGYQRFGDREPFNHDIGHLLVSRRFREAAELLSQKARPGMPEWRVRAALERGESPVKALISLGRRMLSFLIQSYQSFLFNVLLSRRISEGRADPEPGDVRSAAGVFNTFSGSLALPMPGPQVVIPGKLLDELRPIMREEGVSPSDFRVKELGIEVPGGFRQAFVSVPDLSVREVGGGTLLSFTLPRGSYATSVLRELIKPSNPSAQGFF